MAEQGEPPTGKQLEHIRGHPQGAVRLLQQAGVIDTLWLDTVADHHERDDGQGYPRGLQPVPEAARVLRGVDVFMAKISPRQARCDDAADRRAPVISAGQWPGLGHGTDPRHWRASPGTLVTLKSGGAPVTTTDQRNSGLAEYAVVTAQAEAGGLPKILPERVYGMMLV